MYGGLYKAKPFQSSKWLSRKKNSYVFLIKISNDFTAKRHVKHQWEVDFFNYTKSPFLTKIL